MPKNRIHKKKDGRYAYNVTSISGERLSLTSRKNESMKDFKIRCDTLDKEAEGATTKDTFDELFNAWIQAHVIPNLSPSELRVTLPIYRSYVQPYFGHRKISEITRADVYSLLADAAKKNCSSSYIKKIRGVISRPYNWGINALGLNIVSPTQGLTFCSNEQNKKKIKQKNNLISDEDMKLFMEEAKESKYYNYFKILAMTGLRPSESLGLQIQDIKNDHLEIRRGWTVDGYSTLKTDAAPRDIPLTENLRMILIDQRNKIAFTTREGWLFAASAGRPNMDAIKSAFKRILKQTGRWEYGGKTNRKKIAMIRKPLQFTLYSFRHTFATKMAESGINPKVLQELMGHSDISVTLKFYIGVTDGMIREAKEMMAKIAL